MQTLVVDTAGVVKKLEERGFSRTQAEGITEALKELDASSLATKTESQGPRNPTLQILRWRSYRPTGSARRH